MRPAEVAIGYSNAKGPLRKPVFGRCFLQETDLIFYPRQCLRIQLLYAAQDPSNSQPTCFLGQLESQCCQCDWHLGKKVVKKDRATFSAAMDSTCQAVLLISQILRSRLSLGSDMKCKTTANVSEEGISTMPETHCSISSVCPATCGLQKHPAGVHFQTLQFCSGFGDKTSSKPVFCIRWPEVARSQFQANSGQKLVKSLPLSVCLQSG